MSTTITDKYDYNVLCDVCGFKKKASELMKRWDGMMVCEEDWEPRNILDFFRTRNDAHLLPFTRPDDSGEKTWVPVVTGVTGTYTLVTSYVVDSASGVTYKIVLTPSTAVVGTSPTFTLPIGTVVTDKGGSVLTGQGTRIGKPTNGATISVPNFSIGFSPLITLMISGQYIKA